MPAENDKKLRDAKRELNRLPNLFRMCYHFVLVLIENII